MTPAKYSYRWAASVVQSLKSKYPRATESVEIYLDIDDRDLAAYLTIDDPIFPKLRDLIHTADAWMTERPGVGVDLCLCSRIRDFPEEMQERFWTGLDRKRKRTRLREQGSRGGGGSERSERSPPSFGLSYVEVPNDPGPCLQGVLGKVAEAREQEQSGDGLDTGAEKWQ